MRSALLALAVLFTTSAASAALLTDITVFSSDATGNNWNSLIWNTEGHDTDVPDRFNLYVSQDRLADLSPAFLNHGNDASARVAIALAPGDNTFSIYGEGVNVQFDPLQHFVLNLYFGGVQALPRISGVQNLANTNLQPAGHPNGLDLYGNAGAPEAGTLSALVGTQILTLTAFSWITDGQRDVVWPYWANDPPYANGSRTLDYYGSFTVNVRNQVPLPGTLLLAGLGLGALGLVRRRAA